MHIHTRIEVGIRLVLTQPGYLIHTFRRCATRVHELTPPLTAQHRTDVRANLEDMPEVRDWVWTD